MKRYLPAVAAAALVLAFAPRLIQWCRWEPIRNDESLLPISQLPVGATVLTAGDAALIPPFRELPMPGSPEELAMTIPQGSETPHNEGRATITFKTSARGLYTVWVRARWMDSCGNSVAVAVDKHPPRVVGQDAVYGTWHWVMGDRIALTEGEHVLVLAEREDGIAIDQLLLSPDESFVPTGPVADGQASRGVRRFADAFDRSPGHGSPNWTFAGGDWRISFSLDPNRIPLQYALEVIPEENRAATAILDQQPWQGLRASMHVLADRDATLGIEFRGPDSRQRERASIAFAGDRATASNETAGAPRQTQDVPTGLLRPGQWHHLVVERWGWTLRMVLDGRLILQDHSLEPAPLAPALLAAGKRVLFDDVMFTEVDWQAEDAAAFRTPWKVTGGTRWYRTRIPGAATRLKACAGPLAAEGLRDLPVGEVLVWAESDPRNLLVVSGCDNGTHPDRNVWSYRPGDHSPQTEPLIAATGKLTMQRIAWKYRTVESSAFRIGPYLFENPTMPDPADYVDFTPEEQLAIRSAPDAQKLIRKPKQINLVGKSGQYAVWAAERGSWRIADGSLHAAAAPAAARFWQEIDADADVLLKVKLAGPRSAASLSLAEQNGQSIRILLTPPAGDVPPGVIPVRLDPPDQWHAVTVRLRQRSVKTSVDNSAPTEHRIERGTGGGLLLGVQQGRAQFDDFQCIVPRASETTRFYAFDQRESDWWRTGGRWIDHGGIACALASNWVSLVAPQGQGLLTSKHPVPQNVLVSFNIEENSEWLGWDQEPSHIHHPFDNVRVCLFEGADPLNQGYRIEINSRNRTQTVLYRNGIEVAAAAQDASFPIRYVGGHAPYRPRRNRVKLIRRDKALKLVINGQEVLTYIDPTPPQATNVAVGGFDTRINFSRITVRRLP